MEQNEDEKGCREKLHEGRKTQAERRHEAACTGEIKRQPDQPDQKRIDLPVKPVTDWPAHGSQQCQTDPDPAFALQRIKQSPITGNVSPKAQATQKPENEVREVPAELRQSPGDFR